MTRYDAATLSLEATGTLVSGEHDAEVVVSPHGARAFQLATPGPGSREVFKEYDLRSLDVVATHDITDLLPEEYDVESFRVSANGRLFLSLARARGYTVISSAGVAVVDLSARRRLALLASEESSTFLRAASPDGQYAVISEGGARRLYRVEASGLTAAGVVDGTFAQFFGEEVPGGTDLLGYQKGGDFVLARRSDLGEVRRFALPGDAADAPLDVAGARFGLTAGQEEDARYLIYDAATGESLREVPLACSLYCSENFRLSGQRLWGPYGAYQAIAP